MPRRSCFPRDLGIQKAFDNMPCLWDLMLLASAVTSLPLYYDVTTPSTMTSLPPLLWRHYPLWDPLGPDVTSFCGDVITPWIMTSLPLTSLTPLLWCYWLLYYDVIDSSSMTSLSLYNDVKFRYYHVTNSSTMTSLTPLVGRRWPLDYDVTTASQSSTIIFSSITLSVYSPPSPLFSH